ncbi:MAG: amidohydrolase family protein [Pseudomonadota bacterium]
MDALTLISNVDVYSPDPLERRDVLIAGGEILAIEAAGSISIDATLIDGSGKRMVPGLVDALTHPCGGGGEGGFANRTDEMSFTSFVNAGVTSPIAALGTDSLGRTLEVLYGTVMSLRAQGLRALMYTGAYRVPVPTLTGDLAKDLYLIEPVIGAGEVAIADHRGTQPTADELRRLAAECNLAGVLLGYGGVVFVHVGDGNSRLQLLRDAVSGSDLPITALYPTHVNRSRELLDEAAEWTRHGGFVDVTVSTTPELVAAGDIPAIDALRHLLSRGASAERITFSSDAGGSLPLYIDGEFRGLTAATPDCLLALLSEVASSEPELFPTVLTGMTRNPANALKMPTLGRLEPGGFADFLLIDDAGTQLSQVYCAGKPLR